MRLFRRWWDALRIWFSGWLRRDRASIKVARVEELPDELDRNILYAAGQAEYLWFAAMVCPCGCGETLYMSLQQDERPHWNLTEHLDQTASLTPSIWRVKGCRSHFWLRKGVIEWCPNDTTQS